MADSSKATLPAMKPSLTIGTTAEVVKLVTEDMCPDFDGIIVHRLYSTWSMAHHMELAARMVLAPHLHEDEEGIGSHLTIDHIAPTPVGHTVRVVATATEVDRSTVVCDVTTYDGDRVVGRGKQVQRVLPRKKLQALIQRASQ